MYFAVRLSVPQAGGDIPSHNLVQAGVDLLTVFNDRVELPASPFARISEQNGPDSRQWRRQCRGVYGRRCRRDPR